MDEEDLQAFAAAWRRAPDGWTGRRYAEALVDAGRIDEAAAIHREVWDLGYPAGLFSLAWLERDRGNHDLAIELLRQVLPDLDEEDRPLGEGTLGHWLWYLQNDLGAEPHLRAGEHAYPPARSDLASLLLATDRPGEARSVLRAGVEAGEEDSMLPLANLLDEDGDAEAAEALYRRAYDLGDAYSAWNLAIMLDRLGRDEEAEAWRWRAAQGGDELAIRYLAAEQDPD